MEAERSMKTSDCKANRDQFDHGHHDQQLEIVEEMTRRNERVTNCIHQMVSNLAPIHSERCIFRVPEALRYGNEEFYEPKVIAIGPYHRGKPGLAFMEEQKIRYLQNILQRTGSQSVDCLVRAVMPHEETVRKCYAESISYLSSDELVQILVLDGCFIIEVFIRFQMMGSGIIDDNDPVMNSFVLLTTLWKDMLLMENQIPFFILEILFNTMHHDLSIGNELKRQTLVFFYRRLTQYSWDPRDINQLLSKNLFIIDESFIDESITQDIEQLLTKNVCHLLDIIHKAICFRFKESSPTASQSQIEREFVKSATKLKEANVRLKSSLSSEKRSIFDITFKDGELKIPNLGIDGASEIEIRNLIAFELCQRNHMPRFLCDYVLFMDHLIASSDDVDLLTHCRIFNNKIIDSNFVDNMFGNLTSNIIASDNYTYYKISEDLNEYCERPWNKWSANLKQKYFNTPWAIISVIAALVLLGLTITQTVVSIIFR
ncbi:UPF0481 protein At3g47200-like [Impatiens glandulifera]|uniref:UPF0481 protein At3g47200-like n=1 Tax=Impatiens glandulifera TaxID=253017 RepID=UPI001FB18657|nr:UPF0481 protein At3g47200-like [Impatiens glandulifera]